jgi:hypothetical protein
MVTGEADAFSPAEDATGASWVVANLKGFAEGVGSVVPAVFESYARVFHPASRLALNAVDAEEAAAEVRWADGTTRWEKSVPWAEVAAANGRRMHPAAEWGSLTGALHHIYGGDGQPGIWDQPPALGSPPAVVAERLVAVLCKFTSTPEDCWFGVSEIRAGRLRGTLDSAAKFGTPHRSWLLLRGALQSALVSPYPRPWCDLADLWWPQDQAWFVGGDVDLLSTYVGGAASCIDAVIADQALEALPVPLDQGISWDTDTINPLPPRDSSRPTP